jgi:ERCC4-related helicase
MDSFAPGTEVRFKSDPSRRAIVVAEPTIRGGAVWVKVRELAHAGAPQIVSADDLETIVPPTTAVERLLAGVFDPVKLFRSRLTFEKLASPRNDILYSLKATRTDFLPHQFKPVLKFLESPSGGLLIADEVGLGKTIEAGYILKELRARQRRDFKRALVVCPAGLRAKWVAELSRRFDEPFEIADARKLREAAHRVEQGHEQSDFCLVTSFQTLRSRSANKSIEALGPISLTIIDEAHHCRNPNTLTHDVAKTLREISESFVMLSATPVQLGDENLHALLRLIAPDHVGDYGSFQQQFKANRLLLHASRCIAANRSDSRDQTLLALDEVIDLAEVAIPEAALSDLRNRVEQADLTTREEQLELRRDIRELSPLSTLMSRTRKRDVDANRPTRTAWNPEVELTAEERAVYDFITKESRKRYGSSRKNGNSATSRFASISMQQKMASCLPAFLEARDIDPDGYVRYDGVRSIDDLDLDDDLTDDVLDAHAERIREEEEVTAAIDHILRNRVDSKFDCLLEIIDNVNREKPNGKLVVFSFYKRTLGYLRDRLQRSGIGCELISGDVSPKPNDQGVDERTLRVRRFHDDPRVRVLLSSEVGSEGLDFQRACNVVVHYDLPWNPMKVEQRIGRVDRHGQPDKQVYSVSFAIPDTIEERIRRALHARIEAFRDTVGDLEDIIAEKISKLEDIVMTPELTEEQRGLQLEQEVDALIGDALERRRLEESASLLMGHDDTFDQELEALEKSGRSLQPEEIAEFIEGALEAQRVRVVPIRHLSHRASQVADVTGLQTFLRRNLPYGSLGKVDLLSARHGGTADLSYSDSSAPHYITAHHPLTAAALEARKPSFEQNAEIVLSVSIHGSELKTMMDQLGGRTSFLFSLTRLNDVGSGHKSYSIVTDVIGLDGTDVPIALGSELVQSALAKGLDASGHNFANRIDADHIDRLEQSTHQQRTHRERELRQRYERSVQLRHQSEKSRHITMLNSVKGRRDSESFVERAPQYRSMIEGQIRNLEEKLKSIDQEFLNPRPPTVALSRIGIGLLEIVP